MSEFKQKIEKISSQVRDWEPTYSVGVAVRTSAVTAASLNNPWFMSLNHMAPIQTADSALKRDGQMEGFSVVVGDKRSKQGYRTFVTPLGLENTMYSGPSGQSSPTGVADNAPGRMVHLMSNRKETPSVIGTSWLPKGGPIDTNVLFSQNTVEQNSAIMGGPNDLNRDGKLNYQDLRQFAEDRGWYVTSDRGGRHNEGSLHYLGRAVDVRTNAGGKQIKTEAEIQKLKSDAAALGFHVLDERTHPAGQKVWGGPHLHISIPDSTLAQFKPVRGVTPPVNTTTHDIDEKGTVTPTKARSFNAMGARGTTGTKSMTPAEVNKLVGPISNKMVTGIGGKFK